MAPNLCRAAASARLPRDEGLTHTARVGRGGGAAGGKEANGRGFAGGSGAPEAAVAQVEVDELELEGNAAVEHRATAGGGRVPQRRHPVPKVRSDRGARAIGVRDRKGVVLRKPGKMVSKLSWGRNYLFIQRK